MVSRPRELVLALVLGTATVAAGCGGEDNSSASDRDAERAETTTALATTPTSSVSTSAAIGDAEALATSPESAAPNTAVEEGSGDSPGSEPGATTDSATTEPIATPLDDGTYVGYVVAVDLGASTIGFDAAKLLTGADALAAALRDGAVEPGTTNVSGGRYLLNSSPLQRTLAVPSTAPVLLLTGPEAVAPSVSSLRGLESYVGLAHSVASTNGVAVSIAVVGGKVASIEQMAIPTA